jgi:hypothetical protein
VVHPVNVVAKFSPFSKSPFVIEVGDPNAGEVESRKMLIAAATL